MTPDSELAAALRGAFVLHREFLWGLCYRMTGSAADAEDLVQDTFERALQHPPAEIGGMRPWLSRVAINLSCDHLRRRKLQVYRGTFLPEPVSTERLRGLGSRPSAASDVRYELLGKLDVCLFVGARSAAPEGACGALTARCLRLFGSRGGGCARAKRAEYQNAAAPCAAAYGVL